MISPELEKELVAHVGSTFNLDKTFSFTYSVTRNTADKTANTKIESVQTFKFWDTFTAKNTFKSNLGHVLSIEDTIPLEYSYLKLTPRVNVNIGNNEVKPPFGLGSSIAYKKVIETKINFSFKDNRPNPSVYCLLNGRNSTVKLSKNCLEFTEKNIHSAFDLSLKISDKPAATLSFQDNTLKRKIKLTNKSISLENSVSVGKQFNFTFKSGIELNYTRVTPTISISIAYWFFKLTFPLNLPQTYTGMLIMLVPDCVRYIYRYFTRNSRPLPILNQIARMKSEQFAIKNLKKACSLRNSIKIELALIGKNANIMTIYRSILAFGAFSSKKYVFDITVAVSLLVKGDSLEVKELLEEEGVFSPENENINKLRVLILYSKDSVKHLKVFKTSNISI